MSSDIDLPAGVVKLLNSKLECEYATVSGAGVPIDTPTAFFASQGMQKFEITSGLAYPAKVERARRNPKVGLLIEGARGEPIVSIAGMAAIRDADLQANADRYLSEAALHTLKLRATNPADNGQIPWSEGRKAVWYWTRVFVEITPKRILWWESSDEMHRPAHSWHAPENTIFPSSDPAPNGPVSAAPKWPSQPWQELAKDAVDKGLPGHLTMLDLEGHPLSFRVSNICLNKEGFQFDAPAGVPWGSRSGTATLTFLALYTFVGSVTDAGRLQLKLNVERALPVLPMMKNFEELFTPSESTYNALMTRLNHEVARRGQVIPVMPLQLPPPSDGHFRREARMKHDVISTEYTKNV